MEGRLRICGTQTFNDRYHGSNVVPHSLLGDLTDVGKEVVSSRSRAHSSCCSIIFSPRTILVSRCENSMSTSRRRSV